MTGCGLAILVALYTVLATSAALTVNCGVFSKPRLSYALWALAENLPALTLLSYSGPRPYAALSIIVTTVAVYGAYRCRRWFHAISLINALLVAVAGT